ncbi:MAG: hypothetical protein GY936_03265 [Ignavibacteriae bacterium]|nr:hypothetical protein [Ignavibacteriota bacterium]
MKMQINKLIQFSIITTVLFISCAERPIYKLNSLDESVDFYKGKEIVSKKVENVETILEFDDLTPQNYIFYLEIFNSSKNSFTIQPEKISMEVFTKSRNINSSKNGFYNNSVNPEIVLKSIDKEMEQRDDSHDVLTGLNLLGTVFSVAVDLASDSDYKTENVIGDIFIGVDNQIHEEVDYENDIEDMNSEKHFWNTEVLRKTTLHPNEKIGGLVFFPNFKGAKIVRVHIPVDGTVHTYHFKQVRIN